nr:histidine kinase [Kineosporia babensis]
MQGGPVFFSFTCGSAAVFGVTAGLRAWPVWVLQTVAAYAAVAWIIRLDHVPATLAVYLTGVPTLYILIGLAAATARTAVVRHVNLARSALDAIERSAVAAERTRVARELHDSVEKTLRGLAFAADSLPEAVHTRPHLAADLARTVATGAATAADEARELLGMLRADDLDATLAEAIERACREWAAKTGLIVHTQLDEDPPVHVELPVRHEVLRIVREALGNVAKHAGATHTWVDLTLEGSTLRLMIKDDGHGFTVPHDLTALSGAGHYGVVGMAERAQQIGGRLKVFSGADLGAVGGTQVVLWAPATHATATPTTAGTARAGGHPNGANPVSP